jgi:hypothetical protein
MAMTLMSSRGRPSSMIIASASSRSQISAAPHRPELTIA